MQTRKFEEQINSLIELEKYHRRSIFVVDSKSNVNTSATIRLFLISTFSYKAVNLDDLAMQLSGSMYNKDRL